VNLLANLSIYSKTSNNGLSEKWTTSVQRTPTEWRLTLVNRFRNANVAAWIQKRALILALLLISVKQRGGPKMRPHRVQQLGPAGYTLPRLPEVTECL